jgi:hypothetical protein
MNGLGQLVRFYPEQHLEKGIVLMTLDAAIMACMIGFSILLNE